MAVAAYQSLAHPCILGADILQPRVLQRALMDVLLSHTSACVLHLCDLTFRFPLRVFLLLLQPRLTQLKCLVALLAVEQQLVELAFGLAVRRDGLVHGALALDLLGSPCRLQRVHALGLALAQLGLPACLLVPLPHFQLPRHLVLHPSRLRIAATSLACVIAVVVMFFRDRRPCCRLASAGLLLARECPEVIHCQCDTQLADGSAVAAG